MIKRNIVPPLVLIPWRQRQEALCEVKDNLVCIVSSRTASTM